MLDASALLAYLFRETGSALVGTVIEDSCMSAVNLSEVLGRFVRDGHSVIEVQERLAESPIEFVPFLREDAARAASLIPFTREHGLSFADRACIALAMARRERVFTADRVWGALDLKVDVAVIR
ncbi:MAG: type II toxin-antitoxin system VapC family toxin [Pseudomonadota bacterium]